MDSKHAVVIDASGQKIDIVLVNFFMKNNMLMEIPYCYTMREGERLIYEDTSTALSMLKPHWDGSTWEEVAMPEEVTAARPAPMEPRPTETELLAAEMSIALAQMQHETAMAIAELSMVVAEGRA